MDTLISSALEEICCRGSQGLNLSSLWAALTPTPSSPIKASLWTNLLSVPTLQFSINGSGASISPADPKILRYEEAERLNLKIVAKEHLRDCFVGIYDSSGSGVGSLTRKALELIAAAGTTGITQHQLAKKLGIEANKFFYRVKHLECRKLIAKQQVIVKTKEANGDGETKNSSVMNTNMLYLPRYAKQLGVQQRLEINKEERNIDGNVEESDIDGGSSRREASKDDLLVKDFLPEMRTICDKLEAANDKVLVVSDIKKSLGYTKTKGHRAWRNICNRLKDAGVVEEFDAKVNEKPERCLRLLKKLPTKNLHAKTIARGNDPDEEQLVKFGRKFQQTDQLVDLHIDHQIYDAIDAKGSEGVTVNEVCGRLGLDRKRNDSRFHNLFSRFGMRLQAENLKKTVAFRVWSPENSNPGESNVFLERSKGEMGGKNSSTSNIDNHDIPGRSSEVLQERSHSTSEVELLTSENTSYMANGLESCCIISPGDDQTNHALCSPAMVSETLQEPMSMTSDAKDLSMDNELNTASSETTFLSSPKLKSYQMPYLPLTSDAALREKRILERLQDEKYILELELRTWLVSLENKKPKAIDRRTVKRILNKLQRQRKCKIVDINLPVVTNITSKRTVTAVLHPSVQVSDELMDIMFKRQRTFDTNSRVESSLKSKHNESLPVLNSVTRTDTGDGENESNAFLGAMRANGFVPARMTRAKLLHTFLWDYLSSYPGEVDALSTGSLEHAYRLLELEAAMKVIPIQIFLKAVGSSVKGDNMIEKSQKDLCMCDLPVEKRIQLMDSRATGRLSRIIDILRRLKLIRMMPPEHAEDGVKSPSSPMYILELRPYIEEPPSVIAKSNMLPVDLRPRIRHDFMLSNREALDEYWSTLEYCYADADPTAASYAFPGSAVREVFHPKRWTSGPAMSSHQSSELNKLFAKDGFNRKISCKECVKIAKDLNLSVQQILHAFNRKRQKHFDKAKKVANVNEHHQAPERKLSSSKRKMSSTSSSVKRGRVDSDNVNEQLDEHHQVPYIIDHFMEDQEYIPSGQQANCFPLSHEDHHSESAEEINLNRDKEFNSTIDECTPSNSLPMHNRKLAWTDENDRQLLKQYTRHVASMGPNGRVQWDAISDIPAPRRKCIRRLLTLKRNGNFRNSLKRFCNLLQERYVKHLEKMQRPLLNKNGCKSFVREHTSYNIGSDGIADGDKNGFEENRWDDFSDPGIIKAFENLLLVKKMAKLQVPKGAYSEESSSLNTNFYSLEPEFVSSSAPNEDTHKHDHGLREYSQERQRNYTFHQKFLKCLSEGTSVTTRVHKSLPVSNAVELLKLIFLNTSATPKAQNHLAQTLHRYSEHDLFAAFSYLRERKILIGGEGDQPFVLSQQFLQSVYKSFFPSNTGKRAAKFCDWIHEREKDLVKGEIILTVDLQCGDIFQLFALVSSGELSILPCVPDEGVGEVEDPRSSKRKAEDENEHCDGDKSKRMRTLHGEIISRREKGFPGIAVLMHRSSVTIPDSLQLVNSEDLHVMEVDQNDKSSDVLGEKITCSSSQSDRIPEILESNGDPTTRCSGDSPWEAMMRCALLILKSDSNKVNLSGHEIFRTVYMAIKKAGDQGLSLKEVERVVGEDTRDHIIDILQEFGYVLKVNTFDSVRVVDSLFRSKYFLTTSAGSSGEPGQHSVTKLLASIRDHQSVKGTEIENSDHVHKVTILNLPDEVAPATEPHSSNAENASLEEVFLSKQDQDRITRELSSDCLHVPILPWINGNGSINKVVYNGLVRRILGIVMQNPGILEENIIHQIDVLNPQSCRSLLDLMILDKHLIVRKMYQSVSSGPPSLLGSLFESNFNKSKSVYRKHLFANPMSASLL